jgi:hypothetical protein
MFKNRVLLPKRLGVLIFIAIVASVVGFFSCDNGDQTEPIEDQIAEGKILAAKYCQSCHQLPDPSLINRESWEMRVLPAMGKNLGVHIYMGQYFCDDKSSISTPYWQKIVTYYVKSAPVTLKIPKPAIPPLHDWANFTLRTPPKVDKSMPAMTTLISLNPNDGFLYTGDVVSNLYRWDAGLNSKLVKHFDSAVTGLNYLPDTNTGIVTCIGTMAPGNSWKGKVLLLNLDKKEQSKEPEVIADSLPRPVTTVAADFNKDGLMDYVVCAFGHDQGGLYLVQQQADHSYKKSVISNIAGAEQVISGDFNNDGWPDVMCLFAQADEGIRMYLNDHKGGFTTQTLLRFPSVYGSSSFQLVDFNHDGKPDILYTSGDNSDYSKVLKPYHGVYIFTNQGNWKFKQTYFYHIDGCSKAIAADFDHDGDLDICTIAFFADFKNNPDAGFIYLEQTKPNRFTAHEIPINNYGRWLTMEVADIDKDGNEDIILGNFSTAARGLVNQTGFKPNWNMNMPIIVLKNNSGKKR